MYCIDTSSLIHARNRQYPPDVFPAFWERFEEAIGTGVVIAPDPVLDELSEKDDELFGWARNIDGLFVPIDEEIQQLTTDTLTNFQLLAAAHRGRNKADPFVIALARLRQLTVVTQEQNGNTNRPRIPFVCDHYGLECMDILQFMRAEGWRFS